MTLTSLPAGVHVRAPGKINLFLRVGAPQEDGYHELATVYQAVSLYEDVRAYPADKVTVSFTGPIDSSELPEDQSNLAVKAARLLARKTGVTAGVHLEIEKNIPIAGGMGGGSADAAAALVACDALWGTEQSREQLLALAARLGADVPFSLLGGTAIGTGRGDLLSPVLATGDFHWVLVIADFGLLTPEIYGELDRHRDRHTGELVVVHGTPTVDAAVLHALRAGDPVMLADAMQNDLQAAALHAVPELARILELGEEHGALGGIVSGSGPTIAFLATDAAAAIDLQVALSSARLTTLHVHGPVHGARLLA